MTQYTFGTGNLYCTPVGGGAPLRFGALQDVSVEFSGDIKTLHGQYQFPLSVARGKTKIEGKIGSGNIDVEQFNTVFFGQTVSTGETKAVTGESGTVPAGAPYTVTVANGATFRQDLGVYDRTTGAPLKQVASAPTAGQYSVSNAGVYTFAAADANKQVLIDYLYTVAGTGKTLDIGNPLMGFTPRFQLIATQLFENKTFTLCLFSVVIDKLSLPRKMDDFLISDMGYQAQANGANQVGYITTTGGQ